MQKTKLGEKAYMMCHAFTVFNLFHLNYGNSYFFLHKFDIILQ